VKYVHVFSGMEHEAPEGALNWPWVAAEAAHVGDRIERARQAARDHVAAAVAAAAAPPARKPGRPRKAPAPEEGMPDA
jgi:hypothetical protein